jgi:hypothetical protein
MPIKLTMRHLLKQTESFFRVLLNFTKGPPADSSLLSNQRETACALRAAPVDHATIVVFTGVWQERPADQECQTKRVHRVSGKPSKKSNDKTGGPHE